MWRLTKELHCLNRRPEGRVSLLSRFRLTRAEHHLRKGGIVAYPTEGVFGFGCNPLDPSAVQALIALKRRPITKGMILIAADIGQIEPFLKIQDAKSRHRLLSSWPGPVTWVVPAADWVPAWLRGAHSGVAVRVTAHPVAAALCRQFGGPIVSTSANRAGKPPARTALHIRKHFGKEGVMLIPGRVGGLRGPTAIFDALTGKQLR